MWPMKYELSLRLSLKTNLCWCDQQYKSAMFPAS